MILNTNVFSFKYELAYITFVNSTMRKKICLKYLGQFIVQLFLFKKTVSHVVQTLMHVRVKIENAECLKET